jgi:hypothetical protein
MIDARTYGKPVGIRPSEAKETTSPAADASSKDNNCSFPRKNDSFHAQMIVVRSFDQIPRKECPAGSLG